MPQRSRKRRAPRIEALDGLRALAILAIVFYHLGVPWLPSGHMGVVLFLVLGGYLASSTVLSTIRREGSLSLPRLWAKRIVRIWPAMAAMVVFTVALCVAFNHVLLTKLRPDLLPSLLLANNLGAILRGASYFDNLGGTSPLTHLWYLGVDLQFFVVWTALASVFCRKGRSSRIGRRVALALAVVSAVLMAVLYDPNADPTRVYYGPDTRAFAPLLGAWLGLAWPLGGKPVRLDRARHTVRTLPLAIAGPVALVLLVVIMVVVPDTSPFLYRGGMLLVALLSTVIVAAARDRKTLFSRAFSAKPLVWLGSRSFGIYLWHFPLFQLFKVTNADTSPLLILLALVLSLLAAELSVRLIEQRISRKRIPLLLADNPLELAGISRYLAVVPAALLAIGLAVGITGLIVVPEETAVPDEAIQSTGAGAAEAQDISAALAEKGDSTSDEEEETEDADEVEIEDEEETQSSDEIPEGSIYLLPSKKLDTDGKVCPLIIADSVAGSTDWYLEDHVPDAWLDSYVGRRPDQALTVLQKYIKQGVVGDIVVLCTFSNSPVTDDVMDQLIEVCGKRSVYLVNVNIPNAERDQLNDNVKRCVERHDNCTLIDWYTLSQGHTDWFYDDQTHLTPEGQPHYIDMISNAIAEDYVSLGGTALSEEEMQAKEAEEAEAEDTDAEDSGADGADTEDAAETTPAEDGDTSSNS